MPDEKPSLHIDTDWKKQAQEEKRRLAEQQQQQQAPVRPAGVVASPPAASPPARGPAGKGRPAPGPEQRDLPPASLQTIIQSLVTQALYYMGDIAARGMAPTVNLDMAKHHLDTLSVIEEKTRNNLTPDEQKSLDAALYESRIRFIEIASRYAELP